MDHEVQVLILDCHGESRPAICFHLEVAGFKMRVVADVDEVLNLLNNSRITGERFCGLLVNNPFLNVDIASIVEQIGALGIDIPVVFVKESESLKRIVQALSLEHRRPRVYHSEPVRVAELLKMFRTQQGLAGKDDGTLSTAV